MNTLSGYAEPALPSDLVWGVDGHLTDVALTALADGEAPLVGREGADHAGRCEPCAARLGEAAVLSLRVSEALSDRVASTATADALAAFALAADGLARGALAAPAPAAPAPAAPAAPAPAAPAPAAGARAPAASGAPSGRRRPLPVWAVAAALAIALAGSLPSLANADRASCDAASDLARALPLVVRAAPVLVCGAARVEGASVAVSWAAAAVLVVLGLYFARGVSRDSSMEGGEA